MLVLLALLATFAAHIKGDCDAGWTQFGSNCYFPVVASEGGPDPYEATCQGMGANIVSIHSAAENQFVADLITVTGEWCPYIRIGLELVWDSGTTTLTGADWTDGSPVDFGNPVGSAPGTFPWGICGPGDGPQPSSVPARNVTQLWITEVSGWDCPVLTWYNTRPASAEFFGTYYDDDNYDNDYSNDYDHPIDHYDHPFDDNHYHNAYDNDHSVDDDENRSNHHYNTNDNAYDTDDYY
ncbi:C-type lectin [Aphelenchoides avenae]|nr:C-type lectin [Aphelenchus avenae]